MSGPIFLIVICLLVAIGAITYYSGRLAAELTRGQMTRKMLFIGIGSFLGSLVSAVVLQSLHYVPPKQLGIVDKRLSSTYLPPTRIIASKGEYGIQAAALAPGWHFLLWPVYMVTVVDHSQIPQGHIGIVEALDGKFPGIASSTASASSEAGQLPVRPSVLVSPHVWSESDWYEGEKFLEHPGGFRGLQNPPLKAGAHPLNPHLFRLVIVDTNIKSIRFGKTDDNTQVAGLDSQIDTTLSGVGASVNVWARYQVTPEGAFQALEMLGPQNVGEEVEKIVRGAVRVEVRESLRTATLVEFDESAQTYAQNVTNDLNEKLGAYGIKVVEIGFTSIYSTNANAQLEQIHQSRARRQIDVQKVAEEKSRRAVVDAAAATQSAEDESKRKHYLEKAAMFRQAMESSGTGASVMEAYLLSEALGKEQAERLIVAREFAKARLPVVPQVLLSDQPDWNLMRWIGEHRKTENEASKEPAVSR